MTKTIYAGFWIRNLAVLIDSVIMSAITVAIAVVVVPSFSLVGLAWISWGVVFLYTIGFWSWKGATPGKMLFKLKVVNAETLLPPSVGASILRFIGYIISSIPLSLGFFWVIWDKRKQGWHDKLAGTAVIYPRRLETAEPIATEVDTVNDVMTKKELFISITVIIPICLGGLYWYLS